MFLPVILKPCAGMHRYGYKWRHMSAWMGLCKLQTYYVHIVGTGHYADGFCWCICIPPLYLGPYQWLAGPDILPLLSICYWQFAS